MVPITVGPVLILVPATLKESVHVLLPLFSEDFFLPPRPVIIVVVAFVILPLSSAQSLASKRVVYATCISVATYVLWLCSVTYAHKKGILEVNSGWLRMGTLWQGISCVHWNYI